MDRSLSTTRLSAALKEIGHSIPATGITRIEKGQRRVDVDDLAALAIALKVSPTALLLPPTLVGNVEVAPKRSVPAVEAWMWATSRQPLGLPTAGESRRAALDDHQVHSLPPGIRRWSPGEVGMSLDDQATVVAQMEHISFSEAREKVYGRAGAELPESEVGNP
jgi:transcriptional regulator with XRE-family HTH domain